MLVLRNCLQRFEIFEVWSKELFHLHPVDVSECEQVIKTNHQHLEDDFIFFICVAMDIMVVRIVMVLIIIVVMVVMVITVITVSMVIMIVN